MNFNLRQIEAFVQVALLGSFSRAAQQLHLSQAGLSILIRKMEVESGVQLFERTTRNVVLSTAGKDMLPAAQRILANVQQLAQAAADASARRATRVSLALPPRLAAARLPQVLSRFGATHPQVAVSFRECINEEMIARVLSNDVDFGLGFGIEPQGGMTCEAIGLDLLVAVLPATHRLAKRKRVRWCDLVGERIITLPAASAARTLIGQQFVLAGGNFDPVYEANSLVAVAFARHGLGVAIVSAGAHDIAPDPGIVVKELCEPRIRRPLVVVTRRGVVVSEPVRALMNLFAALQVPA
jgi:LysR family transcriptional regulator, carnitine catabolism transcriptional activator